MSRGVMKHRSNIERNVATGSNPYGGDVVPDMQPQSVSPCFIYIQASRREVSIADGKKNAVVQDFKGLFPLGTDILEADEIANIVDRKGVEIIAGRFRVEAIQPKHRHIEVSLDRVL
ncbi:hypothetical protein LCGC14_1405380 [marine sediment metagenome]|uniref:Uncharacterized protein n=1 Tax=marine sediment metagenome TaxID=412755 RepID=A0A0F9JW68_9ZZZZ